MTATPDAVPSGHHDETGAPGTPDDRAWDDRAEQGYYGVPDTAAPPPGAGREPDGDEVGPELPMDAATAFSVEGYEHDDPWNSALCVETTTAVTVLPLTPKTLGGLLEMLREVDHAQRAALGIGPRHDDAGEEPEALPDEERGGRGQRFASAARVVTGSVPVARLWNASTRGRVIIIVGACLFVVLGILFAAFT